MPAPVLTNWFKKDSAPRVGGKGWVFDRLLKVVFSQNFGEVPEWPKGTDCKSVGSAFGGSNPPLPILNLRLVELAGIAQLARASAFQAEGRGFESRFPLHLFG